MGNRTIIALATFSVVLGFGCRPKAGSSDVKTLDQMASGSGANYSCALSQSAQKNLYVSSVAMERVVLSDGSNCSAKSSNATCEAMQDVLNVIAAKNETLVRNYFDTIKGQIKISNDSVLKLCQSSFSDSNSPQFIKPELRAKIDGCWSIPKLADGSYAVAMVHKEDAESIRRNGIRVFGMFYGQAVQQMSKDASGKFAYDPNYIPTDSVRKNLWDKKKELAQLFLQDVKDASASGKYSLDNLPFLTADAKAKVNSTADVSALPLDTLFAKTDAIAMQRFVDTVMGEAFDSGFCQASENTSANSSTFKNTMNVFNGEILGELTQLASTMGTTPINSQPNIAKQASGPVSNQGFGLNTSSGFFAMLMGAMGGTGGAGGMLPGSGMGSTNSASQALQALSLNPTNNPQAAGYNPNLPQSVNPSLPNYNANASALLQQQMVTLQQQASMTAPASGMMSNPALASNGLNMASMMSAFSGLRGSSVNAGGGCSNCSGGCCGGNCGGCSGGSCNCS